jgi:hypothetical protein
MIRKRKFMSIMRDYNGILSIIIGRMNRLFLIANAIKAFNDETGKCPHIETCYAGILEFRAYSIPILNRAVSLHADYGDINRLRVHGFSKTLMDAEWKDEFISKMNPFATLYGNLSNTCIFRHATVGDRRISVINRSFPEPLRATIKHDMIEFYESMYHIYKYFFIDPVRSNGLSENVVGFIKEKSYIDHARTHLGCRSAISIDISKFYDSIKLSGIMTNSLFIKSLEASFYITTGYRFEVESFDRPSHYYLIKELFGLINISFLTIMNYYTHNGQLPTGANYSPVVSNIILAGMDIDIIDNLNDDLKYTRYADDMCISSKSGYKNDGSFSLDIEYVKKMEKIVNESGFYLNYDKTTIMGPRDRKKIAGIVLSDVNGVQSLSIGSEKKLELRKLFEGRKHSDLTSSEMGTLQWVRTINQDQYAFIVAGMSEGPTYSAVRSTPRVRKKKIYNLRMHDVRINRGLTYELYPDYLTTRDGGFARPTLDGGVITEFVPF